MQVETGIQELDCLSLKTFFAPFYEGFQEAVLRSFSLGLANFGQEFELVNSIVDHILPNSAMDHTVKGLQIVVVEAGGLLESLECNCKVAKQELLVADFSMIGCIFGLKHD